MADDAVVEAESVTADAPVEQVESPVTEQEQVAPAQEQDEPVDADVDGLVGGEEDSPEEGDAKPEQQEYSFEGLRPMEEGLEVDEPTAQELSKIAREVGLDQKGFETVFNKLMPFLNQRQEEHLEGVRREFIAVGKADPEMGGAKWAETKSIARKALYQFTDPETRELLHASGLDCHPGIIKAFRAIGLAMSDDAVVRGASGAAPRDPAKAFFYNSKMN